MTKMMGQKIIGSIQGHRHSFRRVGNLNGREIDFEKRANSDQ